MKLFISWAKDEAREIAICLHDWISKVTLGQISTWYSGDPVCLPQGQGFANTILEKAENCDACLVILTQENISAWWVNFEAGFFFGQKKKVYVLLCGGLAPNKLAYKNHPFSATAINFTSFSQEGLTNFLISLKSEDPSWVAMKEQIRKSVNDNFSIMQEKYDSVFSENNQCLADMLSNIRENEQ